MDMEKLLEEYRQLQRIRNVQKILKKNMASLIQFKNVRYQKGYDPPKDDILINIRQGIYPDLGVISFRNNISSIYAIEGSFTFDDQRENDAELKIIFSQGEEEDIFLVFPNKRKKEEFVGVISHYLGLS